MFMASVVGHAIGALSVWELGRRVDWAPREQGAYLLPAALAIAPDLDVVVGMLFLPAGLVSHRGPSHSLLFALGLALAGSLIWLAWQRLRQRETNWLKVFAVLFGCCLMHPVLDYLMGCGPPVPFLWPWLDTGWLSPVQLIPTAYYAKTPSGLLGVMIHPRTWAGIALELISLGGLWLAAHAKRATRRLSFIGMAAMGFGLTAGLYIN
jgi:membrane-bound metal-dependent hydrolase YbcI (DUF457 family)